MDSELGNHRDGPVMLDDPHLTRMANAVRYMRMHPAYQPPNPWPQGMALFALQQTAEGTQLLSVSVVPIEQFEAFSVEEMFLFMDLKADVIAFSPSIDFPQNPEELCELISRMVNVNNLAEIFQYLINNNWVVYRPVNWMPAATDGQINGQ